MMEEDNQEEELTQDYVHPPFPILQFNLHPQQQFKCQTLVICMQGASSIFGMSLLTNRSPIARLNFVRAKQESLADIFLEQNYIFLIFNRSVQQMVEVHFNNFLTKYFKFQICITMCCEFVGNFEKIHSSGLRSIATSKWQQKSICPPLEEGLSGIPAEILILGQIESLKVLCLIGIFDIHELNRDSIEQIFGVVRGKWGLTKNTEVTELIKKYNMRKYANKMYL